MINTKKDIYLFYFLYCAAIIAFFAVVGGCARSCSKKAHETHEKREMERNRRIERRKNSNQRLSYEYKLQETDFLRIWH